MREIEAGNAKSQEEMVARTLTISHFAMQFVLIFQFLQFGQLVLQALQVSLSCFVLLRVSDFMFEFQ